MVIDLFANVIAGIETLQKWIGLIETSEVFCFDFH
jgi:hypothetical protein